MTRAVVVVVVAAAAVAFVVVVVVVAAAAVAFVVVVVVATKCSFFLWLLSAQPVNFSRDFPGSSLTLDDLPYF